MANQVDLGDVAGDHHRLGSQSRCGGNIFICSGVVFAPHQNDKAWFSVRPRIRQRGDFDQVFSNNTHRVKAHRGHTARRTAGADRDRLLRKIAGQKPVFAGFHRRAPSTMRLTSLPLASCLLATAPDRFCRCRRADAKVMSWFWMALRWWFWRWVRPQVAAPVISTGTRPRRPPLGRRALKTRQTQLDVFDLQRLALDAQVGTSPARFTASAAPRPARQTFAAPGVLTSTRFRSVSGFRPVGRTGFVAGVVHRGELNALAQGHGALRQCFRG